jgi:glycosyltransferase involved in cell wall biosynthesis
VLFTLVVPLVPNHDNYFFEFLFELTKNPERVGEVIASRSSGNKRNISLFNSRLDNFLSEHGSNFSVEILHTTENFLAGENRNRAWSLAKYEYVVFCDADDIYSPYRLQMLEEAIEIHKPDLLVHDYFSGDNQAKYTYCEPERLEYVLSPDLFDATFLDVPRNRFNEGRVAGDTNLRVPFKINNHVKIHHAHSCVRSNLKTQFQFSKTYRAEDGQFCRDILEGGNPVVYIPWELSTWANNRSTANIKLHTSRKIFNRIQKAFMPRN